jgi:hypothetical protein
MKETPTPLDDALSLLATRDMRFYGVQGFDNRDSAVLAIDCYSKPVALIDTLADLYAQALPTMTDIQQRSVLSNLRRCPARPTNG